MEIDKAILDDTERQAALYAALSDPTRLRLVWLLSHQPSKAALCVNALAKILGVSQSAISQHLRVLKSVGLVRGERRGFRIHYFINSAGLADLKRLNRSLFGKCWPGRRCRRASKKAKAKR